ncbi:MAG: flippase-like domain-containing protein [Candidatus Aminicenantes bacterium]|nr:flippase-like domain-containing protein [Candidatus Aminicenantes bacterium]
MIKWIKYVIGIAIFCFLLWYLYGHWGELGLLFKLGFFELLVIYFISFIAILNKAGVVKIILKPMGVTALFGDMFLVQNACLLLNYVPMKFGTFFMANYLKRHYSLKYSRFGTFSFYLTFMLSVIASLTGIIAVIFIYGLADIRKQILAGVFLLCFIASIFLLFVPLPIPKGKSSPVIILRDFLLGRSAVSKDMRALFLAVSLLFINFIISSIRLGIIYHSMGIRVHPAGFLVLGALGYIMMFINLTPGALGIRELVLGAGAVVLGVPPEVGITVAIIDRSITLIWAFVVGGACVVWLRHKSPLDFKETKLHFSSKDLI